MGWLIVFHVVLSHIAMFASYRSVQAAVRYSLVQLILALVIVAGSTRTIPGHDIVVSTRWPIVLFTFGCWAVNAAVAAYGHVRRAALASGPSPAPIDMGRARTPPEPSWPSRVYGLYGMTRRASRRMALLLVGVFAFILLAPQALFVAWTGFLNLGAALYEVGMLPRVAFTNSYFAGGAPEFGFLRGEIAWVIYGVVIAAAVIGLIRGAWSIQRDIQLVTGARPASWRSDRRAMQALDTLAIAAGMRTPKLAIIEDPALNAYATGYSDHDATITVTRGLIRSLNARQLDAVLAHELMHIRNGDLAHMMFVMSLTGAKPASVETPQSHALTWSLIALLVIFIVWTGGLEILRPIVTGPAVVVGAAMMIAVLGVLRSLERVPRLLSRLIYMSIAETREFLADAGAVELTKDAPALISALRKIAADNDLQHVPDSIFAMMISSPRPSVAVVHPALDERIAAIWQHADTLKLSHA
jgi:heat shock protein HtpX